MPRARDEVLSKADEVCGSGKCQIIGTFATTMDDMLQKLMHCADYRSRFEQDNCMRNTRVLRTCDQWSSTAKPLMMERLISWEKKLRSTPLNLLPPYALVAERQTVVRDGARRVYVLSEASTRDVPFSDHYVIDIVWALTDLSAGGLPRCEVAIYFSVGWLKATWLKSKFYATFLAEWKKSVQSAQEILATEFSRVS